MNDNLRDMQLLVYCDNASSRTGVHKRREKVITFWRDRITMGDNDPEIDRFDWSVDVPITANLARWHREHPAKESSAVPGVHVVSTPPEDLLNEEPHVTKEVFTAHGGTPVVKWNPFHEGEHPEDRRFHGAHETHVMHCGQCGLDVQRTHDKVWPVLERLYSNGIREISLTALSATIEW